MDYKQEGWFSLVREFEKAGKGIRDFCDKHGVARSTFCYWRKKYLNAQKPESKPVVAVGKFLELEPVQASLEITYPNGVRLQVPSGLNPDQLSRLIHLF